MFAPRWSEGVAVDSNNNEAVFPETLYKFASVRGAMTILEGQTVRFTPVPELNDPLETPRNDLMLKKLIEEGEQMFAQVGEIDLPNQKKMAKFFAHGYMQDQSRLISKKYGVLCLSGRKAISSTLMWSHYAEKHSGLAVGFRSNCSALKGHGQLQRIQYVSPSDLKTDSYSEYLKFKSKDWAYEDEYRSWKLLPPNSYRSAQLQKFDISNVAEIVLGCRPSLLLIRYLERWTRRPGTEGVRLSQTLLHSNGSLELIPVTLIELKMYRESVLKFGAQFAASIEEVDRRRLKWV